MAISRKHYTKVADLIAKRFEIFRSFSKEKRNVPVHEVKAAFGAVIIGLADIYAEDNRNFDRKKFYSACAKLSAYELAMQDLDNVEF